MQEHFTQMLPLCAIYVRIISCFYPHTRMLQAGRLRTHDSSSFIEC